MRDTYHEDLDALSGRLIEMTRLARHAIARATTALLDADLGAAQEVISGDEELNRLDEEIEQSTFDLMARQQPVAKDLRTIITALHMAGDLERMGDHAVHIAKIARRRHPDSAIPAELRSIVLEMGHQAELLVIKAGEVVAQRDAETALELDRDDDRMDQLRRKLLSRILDPGWKHGVEATMDVTLAGRFYERFGDHAVHVADHLVYMVTGSKPKDYEPEV
ncbi:phosphate signaling complex protein PhoU [Marinitenerispora sediminis]|uniref:Phosphate-specific transport system accessory protein PhoU n=1 Tax=Marinitenerispora sediminis TaxID=1931232 RepID=A0A368T3W7_9ACTN|nr:phosphate signaling complex protein PhoU [Marinitenerispora sediminis]RCV54856.1 phosphate transport system regulatory protein PhoU [Marinitenerispora sediminis]RCV57394.1 phosphate transport system regulatory protein PhoU [Marinitenerispora sediminis]RCV60257.1 phosphate transport system regulatory protein PhoU [Marinitenerispora sediminis]